jgi:hypothetical protein
MKKVGGRDCGLFPCPSSGNIQPQTIYVKPKPTTNLKNTKISTLIPQQEKQLKPNEKFTKGLLPLAKRQELINDMLNAITDVNSPEFFLFKTPGLLIYDTYDIYEETAQKAGKLKHGGGLIQKLIGKLHLCNKIVPDSVSQPVIRRYAWIENLAANGRPVPTEQEIFNNIFQPPSAPPVVSQPQQQPVQPTQPVMPPLPKYKLQLSNRIGWAIPTNLNSNLDNVLKNKNITYTDIIALISSLVKKNILTLPESGNYKEYLTTILHCFSPLPYEIMQKILNITNDIPAVVLIQQLENRKTVQTLLTNFENIGNPIVESNPKFNKLLKEILLKKNVNMSQDFPNDLDDIINDGTLLTFKNKFFYILRHLKLLSYFDKSCSLTFHVSIYNDAISINGQTLIDIIIGIESDKKFTINYKYGQEPGPAEKNIVGATFLPDIFLYDDPGYFEDVFRDSDEFTKICLTFLIMFYTYRPRSDNNKLKRYELSVNASENIYEQYGPLLQNIKELRRIEANASRPRSKNTAINITDLHNDLYKQVQDFNINDGKLLIILALQELLEDLFKLGTSNNSESESGSQSSNQSGNESINTGINTVKNLKLLNLLNTLFSTKGGSNTIHILGRKRKIITKNKKKYIRYMNNLITLNKAHKLAKKK